MMNSFFVKLYASYTVEIPFFSHSPEKRKTQLNSTQMSRKKKSATLRQHVFTFGEELVRINTQFFNIITILKHIHSPTQESLSPKRSLRSPISAPATRENVSLRINMFAPSLLSHSLNTHTHTHTYRAGIEEIHLIYNFEDLWCRRLGFERKKKARTTRW